MSDVEKILKKITVLVVDDMETMRSMINYSLQDLGVARTVMAPNGEVAWSTLNNSPIDMIICDWDMPQVTGIELLRRVKKSENHKDIPFLMLTASAEKGNIMNAVKAGVDDYLTKPFQPKELEYRVVKLVRKIKQQA